MNQVQTLYTLKASGVCQTPIASHDNYAWAAPSASGPCLILKHCASAEDYHGPSVKLPFLKSCIYLTASSQRPGHYWGCSPVACTPRGCPRRCSHPCGILTSTPSCLLSCCSMRCELGWLATFMATQIPEQQEKPISTAEGPCHCITNAAKNILQLSGFLPHQKQEHYKVFLAGPVPSRLHRQLYVKVHCENRSHSLWQGRQEFALPWF